MNNKDELFEKILKLKKLIDKLTQNGILNEKISLPNICIIGDIGCGKSSILESILNLNILPIGNGERSTLCPFEINLNHIDSEESFAIFENIKYEDFSKLKEKIEEKLSYIKNLKKIEKSPIILDIFSKKYPGLKLIDLPGFARIEIGEAPKIVDEYPMYIARKYIDNPFTIILCVIPANKSQDYHALSGLRIAKEMNLISEYPTNFRTIGALTKIDIMDLGTDAKNMLLNKEMPIELGYIGVKNKSRRDLFNNISYDEAYKKEKDFFNSNKIYKELPKDILGIDALIKKISKTFFKLIKDNLPNISSSKNEKEIRELLDLIDEYSLREDEIYDIKKIKDENEKIEKKKKKYGNLFG